MRRAVLTFVAVLFAAATSYAAPARSLIVTAQDHSLVEANDCQHFHTQNSTTLPAQARAEEQWNLRLSDIEVLNVRTENEGGIAVRGWDKPYGTLTVCKSAVALTSDQAQKTLDRIKVAVKRGEIAASGPDLDPTQTWWVHMILRVPKRINLDVATANGGIAIRNMSGRVVARATNGGISLAGCTGESSVTTENGGISLDKVSGSVAATTQNGPIALKLRNLDVPPIEARTEDSGAIFCKVKACDNGQANWTADRKRMRIGSAHPTIRLQTFSADIMIEQVR
jgi:hypothetical protein